MSLKFGSVGAVIAAASKKDAVPLLKVGSIPIVRRIVLTLQQAGVFPIVVVTGTEELEVTHQVAPLGVVFIQNTECEKPELFSSVKLGLSYLQGKCDRVVFTPVNAPMFFAQTLNTLLSSGADIVTPTYNGCGGHPIVLKSTVIPKILAYKGENGLRGAIQHCKCTKERTDVPDAGILMSVHNEPQLCQHLQEHNASLLTPSVKISIDKENMFLNSRLKLLMFLIADLQSVRQACLHMGLSYQKAWDMINRLEQETGYAVVTRQHGGKNGGNTMLTDKGRQLMYAFQQYENEVCTFAQQRFDEIFRNTELF
ncbi:MAG: NTP transferase domain-containing protein [Clostridia bacterium]|nr:NTP transferase domain-containing protein [Clostridia bacterium]